MTKFTDFIVDKIGYGVYNVHRNPQGSLYTYIKGKRTLPPRVFQGILSEYLALKYGPQVVYMDFRDFLVSAYIHIHGGGCTLAPPRVYLGYKLIFIM